ncbi:MAG: glucose-6-phosphate isomerase, partial [Pseudomonadales bacterium]
MHSPSASVTWSALQALAKQTEDEKIIDYFLEYPDRVEQMSLRVDNLYLDYSKNKITPQVMQALFKLAEHSALFQRRAQMMSGDIINVTENRPVLHTALRNCSDEPVVVNGRDVMPQIRASLIQIQSFSHKIRSGQWLGYTGKRIKHIVNIGIGGSDLGPNMVCRALLEYKHPDLSFYFVSNVDGLHIQKTLKGL